MHLKPREQTTEIWDWDDKLTLEFNGTHPGVYFLKIDSVTVPTVFLIGDSTVYDQPAASIVDNFSFDPTHPNLVADFTMPVSPNISTSKPLGN